MSGSSELLLFLLNEWKLLLLLTIIFWFYFYCTSTFDFFEKRRIAYKKPVFLLGNMGSRFVAKQSFHEFQLDTYNYFKGKPYGGLFEGRTPVLYILDLDIVQAVAIRDFEHFVDRQSLNSREPAYLGRSLLNLKVAEKFNYMTKWKRMFIMFLVMCMPFGLKYLNVLLLNPESCKDKKDFLQLLIDAAEAEKIEGKHHLDDDTIDAQSLLFLIAGYETSSTLLSFAIHVLATKPDIQTKLRDHIEETTRGKEIDYDVLSQLTYLDGFLSETLRMYPPVARVDRVCTQKYVIPNSSIQLNVGDVIAIPIYGIHMDPDVYPEPQEFRPERFIGDEKRERPQHHFLAFGTGPRNCIGLRFAMYSAKMAMVQLVKNFRFSVCEKTVEPVKFHKRERFLKTESGLWVRLDAL